MINIHIDNKEFECKEGESVLAIALENGIDIPHFCYHEDLPIEAHCRTCLVEVEPDGDIVTSCSLKAKEGLRVNTDTRRVHQLRHQNLELLLANHQNHCPRCKKGDYCKTAQIMKDYRVSGKQYKKPEIKDILHKLGTAAEIDPDACIACGKCVEICDKLGTCFLQMKGKGAQAHAYYNPDPKVDCIYCGQCTVHCPVGAIREQSHLEEVEKVLKDKEKIVIVQMAPSVRASIGEEFGDKPGKDYTEKMYTALREIGFDKIFDVNMGADITTWVEAEELVERIEGKGGPLPMFTSCCPGWVKYVEFYHPELIPHLTTSRSPQIHSGAAYKTWWAEKEGIDPKKIVVVSLMPCTSKKYEARHKKLKIDGMWPVDYVLTVRETGNLLRRHGIDLPNIEPSKVDSYGEYSGAAVIYGASGGVMESALRTAYHFVTGKELKKLEFEEVRGMEGIKKAEIEWGDLKIKVAIVTTAKNMAKVILELKKDPKAYDYIEVMACPGGCIGGGGQPIPSTERIIKKRIKGLYNIDDKMKLRTAHQNEVVKDFMENYIAKLPKERQHELLHTHYEQKKKFE